MKNTLSIYRDETKKTEYTKLNFDFDVVNLIDSIKVKNNINDVRINPDIIIYNYSECGEEHDLRTIAKWDFDDYLEGNLLEGDNKKECILIGTCDYFTKSYHFLDGKSRINFGKIQDPLEIIKDLLFRS
ncbi:hypothetical protein GLF_1674 [Gluconobacter frateurii NBRC 101659]|nr:hypothetical protein GLF_1674 [Gluconobacter frateurii NBRC 101659]